MPTYRCVASLFAFAVAGVACGPAPDKPVPAAKQSQPAAGDEAEAQAPADADADAKPPAEDGETKIKPAGPLTPEEEALIAADVKDLSPEDRRKRAYALRKKIMQNPDSPAAKSLQRTADALKRGELNVPDHLKKGQSAGHDHPAEPGQAPNL